jgi:hypothetical protein
MERTPQPEGWAGSSLPSESYWRRSNVGLRAACRAGARVVTCDEWKQYVAGLFRDADADRDGFLTRQEFATLTRSDRLFDVAGFDYFDANADGRLSLFEMADKPNPAFELLDKNGDCVISAEERVNQRSYARDDGKSQGAASQSGRRK